MGAGRAHADGAWFASQRARVTVQKAAQIVDAQPAYGLGDGHGHVSDVVDVGAHASLRQGPLLCAANVAVIHRVAPALRDRSHGRFDIVHNTLWPVPKRASDIAVSLWRWKAR